MSQPDETTGTTLEGQVLAESPAVAVETVQELLPAARPLVEFRTGQMVQFQILPMLVFSFSAEQAARLKHVDLPPTEHNWRQSMVKADKAKGVQVGGVRAMLPELIQILRDLNSRNYTLLANSGKQQSAKVVLEETLEQLTKYFNDKVPFGSLPEADRDLLPSFHFWTDKAEVEEPTMITQINGVFAIVVPVRSITDYTKALAGILRRCQHNGPMFLSYFIDGDTEALDSTCALTEQRMNLVRKGFSCYTRNLLTANTDGYWWIPRFRTTIERVLTPTEGTYLVSLVSAQAGDEQPPVADGKE